jgi:hypothetical protein
MSSATVRREVLNELGGFDTAIRGTDDYDLWLRILLTGRTCVRAGATPLLLQRGRHDSVSKDERMMDQGLIAVLRAAADSPSMPPAAREIAEQRIAETRRDLQMRDSRNPLPRAAWTLRARAVAVRNRLRFDHYWPAEPPPKVAAAFPELAQPARRSGRG